MIQVLYRWRVPRENHEAFLAAWEVVTTGIRGDTPGARGSICLASHDDPTEIVTMARWDSRAQWEAFVGAAKDARMRPMRELGELVSMRSYEQRGDHTV